nr:hypothetical protein BdHM001_35630 [Bdellovibrio sp. HM001]
MSTVFDSLYRTHEGFSSGTRESVKVTDGDSRGCPLGDLILPEKENARQMFGIIRISKIKLLISLSPY